jgi:hypothetical protein
MRYAQLGQRLEHCFLLVEVCCEERLYEKRRPEVSLEQLILKRVQTRICRVRSLVYRRCPKRRMQCSLYHDIDPYRPMYTI